MFLNVKNLSKSYGTDETIIKKLNFSLKKAKLFLLLVKAVQVKPPF